LFTRKLAGQDRAETTSILTGLISGGSISLLVPFVWSAPEAAWVWALSILLGIIGGTGHFLLARAFERGPASLLAPFNYLQLLGAAATGYALYGDFPDAVTWAGAAVIVMAGLYIARRERLRRHNSM
jgi:drug/metabolite transporter (DMT)-like permease